jgi:hypothetical protein
MKSWNPIVNALEQVEVTKKTIKKRRRIKTTRKDTASEKQLRKEK